MAPTVTIVDYEAGNLTSVRLAVEKLGRRALVTPDPEEVRRAERVVFPGVGAAGQVMDSLRRSGLGDALGEYAATGRLLLGICIGAQVILSHSDEGDVECIGLMDGEVTRLEVPEEAKVPHIGWNQVAVLRPHPLFDGVEDDSQFYFVHSYAPRPAREETVIGSTEYYAPFVSALAQDNIVATQFHPERSGRVGLKVLDNFLNWTP